MFTTVKIKFSISAHTYGHTHLQLSPSGWHCVIWHIHFLGWICLQCCRGSHKPHWGIPANPWMMSLSKHTLWTANKSQLRKSVLLITVLFFWWWWFFSTEVWTNLIEPLGVWLQNECDPVFFHCTPTSVSLVFPFGPALNYVTLHRAMYPKPCPQGHQVCPCQYSVTSALL